MNIIENVDHLRVVYGKSEDYIISFYKDRDRCSSELGGRFEK